MPTTKLGENITNILTCYQSKQRYTFGHYTVFLHIEVKYTSHYFDFFSREMQRRTGQGILRTFLLWLKRNHSQTVKVSSFNKLFFPVGSHLVQMPKSSLTFCCLLLISDAGRCSVRKGVLRNFTKFIGKHLCQSLFFNKLY